MTKDKISFWKSFTVSFLFLLVNLLFFVVIAYIFIGNKPDWQTFLGFWPLFLTIFFIAYILYSIVFAYLTSMLSKFSVKYVIYFMLFVLIANVLLTILYYAFPIDWLSINEGLRKIYWYEWIVQNSGYWFLPFTLLVQFIISIWYKKNKLIRIIL